MRIWKCITFGKSLPSVCVAGVMVSTVLALLAGGTVSAAEVVIHVSPRGDDAWSGIPAEPNAGKTDGPVGSLIGARDAVRRLRAAGKAGPVRVVVADGTYRVAEPLVLRPEDGGSAGAPVRYEAAPGAMPVFSGGRTIAGFKPVGEGVWAAQVPEVAAGKWYFEQLFVDGKRAVRARDPNRFWYYMDRVEEEILDGERGGDGRRAKKARQTVKLRADDTVILRGLKPDELKDVNLVVYHKWDNTRRFIDRFDAATSTLVTTGGGMKPWTPWKRNSHYILENCKAACDEPGEWFLGRDGVLIYRPLPSQDMARAEVVAPVSERFILIQGSAAKPVAHVTFSGLAFRHGQWLTLERGFEPHQAAAPIEAAGRENTVRNNILAFSDEGQVAVSKPDPGGHMAVTFERNIVYFDRGTLLGYKGWNTGAKVDLRNNIYWRAKGQSFDFAGKSWDQWRAMGRDKGSVIADPKFVDPDNYDFRFASDEVIKQTGFKPFDYSQAGVYGDADWIALAKATANSNKESYHDKPR